MDRTEALELLQLEESASKEKITLTYKKLFSEFQLRLTNAPTPQLRKLYKRNLENLNHAYQLLNSEGASQNSLDLPSDQPVFQDSPASGLAKPATPKKSIPKKDHKEEGKSKGLLVPILGFISVFAVAGAIFLFMEYQKVTTEKAGLQDTFNITSSELENLRGDIENISENGEMKINNAFSGAITVFWWSVLYRDEDGNYKSFDSGAYGYPSKEIRSGQTLTFNHLNGQEVVWDGSVVYYSILANYRGDFYNFSGIWSEKARDGRLTISPPQ